MQKDHRYSSNGSKTSAIPCIYWFPAGQYWIGKNKLHFNLQQQSSHFSHYKGSNTEINEMYVIDELMIKFFNWMPSDGCTIHYMSM